MELMLVNGEYITSLQLLDEINMFRSEFEEKRELRHDTLRDIIKNEFNEEILSQKILEKVVSSDGGRPLKVYLLTPSQAKQVLIRESRVVRKAVVKHIEKLERVYIKHLEMLAGYKDKVRYYRDYHKDIETALKTFKEMPSLTEKQRANILNEISINYSKPMLIPVDQIEDENNPQKGQTDFSKTDFYKE